MFRLLGSPKGFNDLLVFWFLFLRNSTTLLLMFFSHRCMDRIYIYMFTHQLVTTCLVHQFYGSKEKKQMVQPGKGVILWNVLQCVQCSTSEGLLWQHLGVFNWSPTARFLGGGTFFSPKTCACSTCPARTKSHFLIQKSRHHLGRTNMKTSCYFLEPKIFIIAHVTLFVCKYHMASWKKSFGVNIENCMGLVSKLLLFGLMSEPFVRFAISPPIRLRKILKTPPLFCFRIEI